MKKVLAIVLASAMMLGLCGCKKKFSQKKYLQPKAEEMVTFLTEMSSDERFIRAMGNKELNTYCDDWSRANIDKNKEIIVLDGDQLEMIVQYSMGEDLENFKEEYKDYISARFCSGAMSILNASNGASILTASSIIQYTRTYVPDHEIDNQVWLVPTTRDDVYFGVSFISSGDEAIIASVCYIIAPNGVDDLIEKAFGTKVKFDEVEWVE